MSSKIEQYSIAAWCLLYWHVLIIGFLLLTCTAGDIANQISTRRLVFVSCGMAPWRSYGTYKPWICSILQHVEQILHYPFEFLYRWHRYQDLQQARYRWYVTRWIASKTIGPWARGSQGSSLRKIVFERALRLYMITICIATIFIVTSACCKRI